MVMKARFMSERTRVNRRDQILARARERVSETEPDAIENNTVSGAMYMPGIRRSGGIDAILAPRSERQQLRWNVVLNSARNHRQVEGYRRSELLRQLPVVGEYIADKIVHRTLSKYS